MMSYDVSSDILRLRLLFEFAVISDQSDCTDYSCVRKGSRMRAISNMYGPRADYVLIHVAYSSNENNICSIT